MEVDATFSTVVAEGGNMVATGQAFDGGGCWSIRGLSNNEEDKVVRRMRRVVSNYGKFVAEIVKAKCT